MADFDGFGGSNALKSLETELQSQVATALSDLHQRIEHAFTSAHDRIQSMRNAATHLVDAFEQEAHKVRDALAAAQQVAHVKSDLLQAAQANIDTVVAAGDSAIAQGADVLNQAVHAFEAEATTVEGAANDALSQALQELHQGLSALEQRIAHTDHLMTEGEQYLTEFGDLGEQKVHALIDQLSQLGEHTHAMLDQVDQALVAAAHHGSSILTEGVAAAVQALTDTSGKVDDAAHALGTLAESLGGDFGEAVEKVTHLIEEVNAIIEKIRPILDLAEQLS